MNRGGYGALGVPVRLLILCFLAACAEAPPAPQVPVVPVVPVVAPVPEVAPVAVNTVVPAPDILKAEGGDLTIQPIYHGTVLFSQGGKTWIVDPWSRGPLGVRKADIVLITDIHDDHMDPKAIEAMTRIASVLSNASQASGARRRKTTFRRTKMRVGCTSTSVIRQPHRKPASSPRYDELLPGSVAFVHRRPEARAGK